ncbi:hypothetical protein [Methylibium sp.]|uniref:hypothetical protein n=1 Tax=Methylibium sp. TaxID=2067992 RepID=UPI003D099545
MTRIAMFHKKGAAVWLMACAASTAWGQGASSEKLLRERLAAERGQIESAYVVREHECAQRFLVTACLETARTQRREALVRLNASEAALDDAERTRRAVARQQSIDAKQAQQARDLRERASAPVMPFAPASAALRVPRAPAPVAPPPVDAAQRRLDEQQARSEHEARQQQIETRQQAAAKRQAQRVSSGKRPAAPLPPVQGASAP